MRLKEQMRYQATPEQVFAMIVDPAFHEAKCLSTGAVDHSVEITSGQDGGATVFVRRTMPPAELPENIRAFVRNGLVIIERHAWGRAKTGGRRDAAIMVEIEGAPIKFSGVTRLRPDADGTEQTFDGDLRAAVPFFGRKIEVAAEPAIRSTLEAEARVALAWLAERRS